MKTLLVLAVIISTLACNAATWTFHAWQDNFADVILGEEFSGLPWHHADTQFDFGYDAAFPSHPVTGVYWWDGSFDSMPESSVISIEAPVGWRFQGFYVCQGYPDYNGWWGPWGGFESQEDLLTLPVGEYWLDFAPDTHYRISSVEPADFGKWAWDGSINPSWVEPLSATDATGRKLGHRNKK